MIVKVSMTLYTLGQAGQTGNAMSFSFWLIQFLKCLELNKLYIVRGAYRVSSIPTCIVEMMQEAAGMWSSFVYSI